MLAALLSAKVTGQGSHVMTSLLESQLSSMVNVAGNWLISGEDAERRGTAHPSLCPYQAFDTSDGAYIVGVGNDGQFKKFANIVGRPEWGDDARFVTNADRVTHRTELVPMINAITTSQTTEYWSKLFDNQGFPCGPINSMQQAFEDPQSQHLDMVSNFKHPTAGDIKLTGLPVKFGTPDLSLEDVRVENQKRLRLPPPLLGQHTYEILESLGYQDTQISDLLSKEIVGCYRY